MDVARVLVEVNLMKPLPQKISFKDRNQCNTTVEVIYPVHFVMVGDILGRTVRSQNQFSSFRVLRVQRSNMLTPQRERRWS